MGAVTALRYATMHPEIVAAVYDSPFKSLSSVVKDWTKKNSTVPIFLVHMALKVVSTTIK
jgi:pimeloyl-ACP methyl ester carboxylesterase